MSIATAVYLVSQTFPGGALRVNPALFARRITRLPYRPARAVRARLSRALASLHIGAADGCGTTKTP